MLTEEERDRYLRHLLLKEIGGQGQQKLKSARALVVGAGGVGAPAILYLAAAGVGVIGVADDDRVERSNLQRQIIYRELDVGAGKAARAAAAAAALNPSVHVIAHEVRIAAANAPQLFDDYDLVLEGVDSFATRHLINEAAIARRRPVVSAAIGRWEGQVSVFKPWAGGDLPCYRCLVPEAPPQSEILTCAEEGVAGPLAGVIGSLAALEVLKEILGIGETLAGRLLIYDGLSAAVRRVRLPRDPSCLDCSGIERRG